MDNLCSEPGTCCKASSTAKMFECSRAIDGIVSVGENNEWVTTGERDLAWIKVNIAIERVCARNKIPIKQRTANRKLS